MGMLEWVVGGWMSFLINQLGLGREEMLDLATSSAAVEFRFCPVHASNNFVNHCKYVSLNSSFIVQFFFDFVISSLNSFDTPDGTKILMTHPNPFEFEKQRQAAEDRTIAGGVGMRRVADKLIDATLVNTNRRHFGIGIVGDLIGTDYRKSRMDTQVEKQMSEMDDYRWKNFTIDFHVNSKLITDIIRDSSLMNSEFIDHD